MMPQVIATLTYWIDSDYIYQLTSFQGCFVSGYLTACPNLRACDITYSQYYLVISNSLNCTKN